MSNFPKKVCVCVCSSVLLRTLSRSMYGNFPLKLWNWKYVFQKWPSRRSSIFWIWTPGPMEPQKSFFPPHHHHFGPALKNPSRKGKWDEDFRRWKANHHQVNHVQLVLVWLAANIQHRLEVFPDRRCLGGRLSQDSLSRSEGAYGVTAWCDALGWATYSGWYRILCDGTC